MKSISESATIDLSDSSKPSTIWIKLKGLLFIGTLEGIPLILHMLLYQENLTLGAYLPAQDLPLIGWLFPYSVTAQTLLVFLLAAASVFLPYVIWLKWLARPSDFNIKVFVRSPLNVIYTSLMLSLYVLAIALELYNFALFLNPESILGDPNAISDTESLRAQYSILGAVVLVALVNAIGLLSAQCYLSMNTKIEEMTS